MQINIELILQILGIAIPATIAIARLTPTTKDDKIMEKIRKIFVAISTLGLPDRIEIPIKKKKY